MQTQSHLVSTTEELKNSKIDKERLQRQVKSQQENIESLADSLTICVSLIENRGFVQCLTCHRM
uniref:Uncharacterized protein n=1 Tax=Glossina morsitans morsitans TaxID=37546 RepID=A0A1B0GAM3_GLOMM